MRQNQIDETFPYQPPSRVCEPIISSAMIVFHTQDQDQDLGPNPNPNPITFGVLNFNIRNEIPIVKEIYIVFNVDCSRTMLDICPDGNTKMTNIISTLENMIRQFHKITNSKIFIRVQSFDTNIHVNIDTTEQLFTMDIENLISKIHEIKPAGPKNIEKALRSAATHLNIYKNEHPQTYVAHIFLTDGQITQTNININTDTNTNTDTDTEYLKRLVGRDYLNIFLGYGTIHDSSNLLMNLAASGKLNEYHLINDVEKSNIVIHRLLYKAIEDVTFVGEYCEIYDNISDTWKTELYIGNIISEQKTTYQIRSSESDKALISIFGRKIHKTRMFEKITDDIILQAQASPVPVFLKCDLTSYIFKQRTQEMCNAVKTILESEKKYKKILGTNIFFNKFNKEIPEKISEYEKYGKEIQAKKEQIKNQINDFYQEMTIYILKNNLKKYSLMATLCDDINNGIDAITTETETKNVATKTTENTETETKNVATENTETETETETETKTKNVATENTETETETKNTATINPETIYTETKQLITKQLTKQLIKILIIILLIKLIIIIK